MFPLTSAEAFGRYLITSTITKGLDCVYENWKYLRGENKTKENKNAYVFIYFIYFTTTIQVYEIVQRGCWLYMCLYSIHIYIVYSRLNAW